MAGAPRVDEVVVLPPTELDVATVVELSRSLEEACALAPARVVIDLDGVTFCDVAALRVLLAYTERLAEGGCALELARPPRALRRLVATVGVADRLRFRPR